MSRKTMWSAACLAALLCACTVPATDATPADEQAILALMHATWDRPQTTLDAGPVVVEGEHALVDWTQGGMGGRALLERQAGHWITVLCAGDGIRSADALIEAGVPRAQAQAMAAKLATAETKVSSDRLALMSNFAGVVRMNGGSPDHH